MSIVGALKGAAKSVEGVIEGDIEKVVKGFAQCALNTAGTVIRHAVHEEVGKVISSTGNQIANDDIDEDSVV
jgi:hypothetical protein